VGVRLAELRYGEGRSLEITVGRDEHFIKRLEAFSDVVIGFSLALLALSLIVPNHAATLATHYLWLVAYVWTFAFVCSMWASHTWTFRHVFVPTPGSVMLNYAKLGLIVLLIFSVQVLLRAFDQGDARDVIVANELYWGCLVAYWIVAGAILAVGMRARGAALPPEVARNCLRRIWRIAAAAPLTVAGIVIAAHGAPSQTATTIALYMIVGIAAGAFAGRLATRRSAP